MREERIDSHHHLWKYTPAEYPWMLRGMEAIRRDFLVPDLEQAMRAGGITGVVTVQARQSLVETEWLLDLAAHHSFMRGIVGWVPLVDSGVGSLLARYAAHPKLKAVRHVLHDEPDDFYILREDFNRGIARLRDFGLRYDILIFERHLPQTIAFVDRHPRQPFIVDHIAKPRIREKILSPWRERIKDLARRENVYCKLSGLVTEADWNEWTEADLKPFLEVALECFGPQRLMFGSDWPVALVACGYEKWVRVVERATATLSIAERDCLFGNTAKEAYGL
ncbi:MAG TPA: amidohydrolase family protein [Terriglobales bacterium]|nr:amidohydrolase family protein [Terriglobales bacterium]